MDSLGGGSQQTGGSVVQEISPSAYAQAATDQNLGVTQAEGLYSAGVNNAIQQLQQQYGIATQAQMPSSQSGMNALYQMDYLEGLNPPNPGTAPVAPTLQSELANVTGAQTQAYINANSGDIIQTNQNGANYLTPTYTGYGTNPNDQGYATLMSAAQQQAAQAQAQGFSGDPNAVAAYGNGMLLNGNGQIGGQSGGVGPGNPSLAFNVSGPGSVYNEAQLGVANQLLQQALPGYQTALQQYNAQNALYNQYQAKGPATSADIQNIVAGQPGYQAQLSQGLAAINNAGSAGNNLGSGATLNALQNYGQNTLSTYYGNMLSNLANIAGLGQGATNNISSLQSNLGNSIAGLDTGLGTNLGNAAISQGNNNANAAIGEGTTYNVLGQQSSSGAGGLGSLLGGAASLLGSTSTGSGLAGLFG